MKGSKAGARRSEDPAIADVQTAPARRQAKATAKVSVTIEKVALRWVTEQAKRDKTTVSAKMTEAIKALRRDEARREVVAYLGDAGKLTDEDRRRIDAEWA